MAHWRLLTRLHASEDRSVLKSGRSNLRQLQLNTELRQTQELGKIYLQTLWKLASAIRDSTPVTRDMLLFSSHIKRKGRLFSEADSYLIQTAIRRSFPMRSGAESDVDRKSLYSSSFR
ncbi:hypothetical protein WMY93_010121 [Mugilogobius chulae]|uniref:Uncharacterized protein n=1 Tax=Mugilogobius chulae TaxID=88201 RepID=A0AAW0PA64_9GOBI